MVFQLRNNKGSVYFGLLHDESIISITFDIWANNKGQYVDFSPTLLCYCFENKTNRNIPIDDAREIWKQLIEKGWKIFELK